MKFLCPLTLALALLAGCATQKQTPVIITPAPVVTNAPANPLASIMPPGLVPRIMPEQPTPATPTFTIMSRAQPAVIGTPSATIELMPAELNLEWEASPDPSVTHYAIYWGPGSRQYLNQIMVMSTSGLVTNLTIGEEDWFAVTALDDTGLESDFSAELDIIIPQYIKLHFDVGSAIESSPDLFNWSPRSCFVRTNNVFIVSQDTNKPTEFYRAVDYEPATLP